MRGNAEQYFKPARKAPGWRALTLASRTATRITKGHGRLEKRHLACLADETGFLDWPGVKQLFQLRRLALNEQTGEVVTEDVRYGIASLDIGRCSASRLLELIQSY